MERAARIKRKTKETDISIVWALDGEGTYSISTGVPFLNHMLELFARHGFFNLTVKAKGDTDVDYHHTVEDLGITLGKALKQALGGFEGIRRYGHALIPMDEALCICVIDMSGRPSLVWKGKLAGKIGDFDVQVVKEFLQGFVNEARITLHVNLMYGDNLHHRVESVFKAFARALKDAASKDEAVTGPLSTKGVL